MKHTVNALLVLFLVSGTGQNSLGQETLKQPDSTLVYNFDSLLDSVPSRRTKYRSIWADTSVHLEIHAEWDTVPSRWVNTEMIEERLDDTGNQLYHMESSWDEDHSQWKGKKRILKEYDSIGNMISSEDYFLGLNEGGESVWYGGSKSVLIYNDDNLATNVVQFSYGSGGDWVPVDSFVHVRDVPDLVLETCNYKWVPDSVFWALKLCKQRLKQYDGEGKVISQAEYRKERIEADWFPYDSITYSYDEKGDKNLEIDFIWSEGTKTWEYERKWEKIYDETMDLWLQVRYKWDISSEDWKGYSLVSGTRYEEGRSAFAVGMWNSSGTSITWLTRSVSETNPEGLITRKTEFNWYSSASEWKEKRQTLFFFNDSLELVLEERFDWDQMAAGYKLQGKAFHYYPVVILSNLGTVESNYAEWLIYPNPVKRLLRIFGQDQPQRVEIFNTKGRLVRVADRDQVDMFDLPDALYIVRIHHDSMINSFKVIKE